MGNTFFAHAKQLLPKKATWNIKLKTKPTSIIDVGGAGDCGFRAVAAAIIDNIAVRPQTNRHLLVKILQRHHQYFPLPPAAGLLTPADRLLQSIDNKPGKMGEFLPELAYTLRQIAVDQIREHPARYRNAIVNGYGGLSPAEMRKQTTWIDIAAIAALADALNLNVKVSAVLPNKKLPLDLEYGPPKQVKGVAGVVSPFFQGKQDPSSKEEIQPDPIQISLEGKHYKPYVKKPERFQLTSYKSVVQPVNEPVFNDPPLETLLKRIEEDDKRLVDVFNDNVTRLTYLVADNKLTKDELIAIYTKGLKDSDYLRSCNDYLNLEYGSQAFFEGASANSKRPMKDVVILEDNFEAQVIGELIYALARAITIGQLDENLVFEAQVQDDEEHSKAYCSLS
ncbi:Predicted cysteine protease (OTU family) [Legionella beliardensis]|uniref:Predicted cysteine protease (OTU family) n=1 Tax=Legionella beliardensis TaxID=91822 RepID=A0A378HZ19_9GAMM|nr:hypothetical protein [Legionella beliardensis]STX27625.1 Predicted cysteine protease (OTU family) [Legionella beliardensis]